MISVRTLLFALWALATLSGCYVMHLAGGQLHLINDQKPLAQAIAEERDPMRKRLLEEVPSIRQFARDVLEMRASESYVGYYAVDRDWLTLILSAAPRDKLEPYTRWYPVAGRVPYRSFFDEARARRAQAELEAKGYDTILHQSPAYSTLGFFRDPVTSPMLDGRLPCPLPVDPSALDACRLAGLAETLLHELTHQHLYLSGQTDFNEQLASFVGRTAVIEYLTYRGLYDEALRARLQIAFDRQQAYADVVSAAGQELEALYAMDIPRAEKLARRAPVFARVKQRVRELFPDSRYLDQPINNASLLQSLRYDRRAPALDALWKQAHGHWGDFWSLVRERYQR